MHIEPLYGESLKTGRGGAQRIGSGLDAGQGIGSGGGGYSLIHNAGGLIRQGDLNAGNDGVGRIQHVSRDTTSIDLRQKRVRGQDHDKQKKGSKPRTHARYRSLHWMKSPETEILVTLLDRAVRLQGSAQRSEICDRPRLVARCIGFESLPSSFLTTDRDYSHTAALQSRKLLITCKNTQLLKFPKRRRGSRAAPRPIFRAPVNCADRGDSRGFPVHSLYGP